MSKNNYTPKNCEICNRHIIIDELEPFGMENHGYLARVTRNYYGNSVDSYECKECIKVPVYPWEVYQDPDRILLYHHVETDSWSTPVFNWIDRRIDNILSGGVELTSTGQPLDGFVPNVPKYQYWLRDLQPDEVEKIKSAPKKIIIIWHKINLTNSVDNIRDDNCGPPEIIDNTKARY